MPRTSPLAPQAAEDCAVDVMDVVPQVMDALRLAMRQHVGGQLSVPQFRCLAFVARQPGSSVGAVAAFLGVTMPTASAMVDRLMRAGQVASRTSTEDRRRIELELTPAGRALLRRIRRDAQSELAQSLASRGEDELRKVREGLAVLRHAFGAA